MHFESFSFGSIQIDGITYEHDIVIDRGEVRKRRKGPSKTIPRCVRTHAIVAQGKDTLEVSSARDWHGCWCSAGDGPSQAGSPAPQDQAVHRADSARH